MQGSNEEMRVGRWRGVEVDGQVEEVLISPPQTHCDIFSFMLPVRSSAQCASRVGMCTPQMISRLSYFNTFTWLLSPSLMIDLVSFHLKNYIKSQSANLFSTGLHAKSYHTGKLSGTHRFHLIAWMQYCGFIWTELQIWYDMRYFSIWAGIWMYRTLQDYFLTANCLWYLFNTLEKRTDEEWMDFSVKIQFPWSNRKSCFWSRRISSKETPELIICTSTALSWPEHTSMAVLMLCQVIYIHTKHLVTLSFLFSFFTGLIAYYVWWGGFFALLLLWF